MWEKLAKASSLRAPAGQIQGTNPESCLGYLREAAGIFQSVGEPESAATCYCDLEEYERAGNFCSKHRYMSIDQVVVALVYGLF